MLLLFITPTTSEAAKYYYDKYTVTTQVTENKVYTGDSTFTYTGSASGSRGKVLYKSYRIDDNGKISESGSGTRVTTNSHISSGYKYTVSGTNRLREVYSVESLGGGEHKYSYRGYTITTGTIEVRGSFLSNLIAENGTYPSNGKHTDGYWYVRGAIADTAPPTINLSATPTSPTNSDVTINASIADSSGVSIKKYASGSRSTSYFTSSGTNLGASFKVTSNGTYTVYARDTLGNDTVKTININNIDKTSPVITLGSYTTSPTNKSITVTATTNEGTLNKASHTFTSNGSFTFTATDAVGNVTNRTVTINNIDKTSPVITLGSYTTSPTNKNVTVTATTNEGTLNKASHTFTSNGSFTFTATDTAGNVTNKTVNITNIDKTSPVITLGSYTTSPTNQNITVTATTNEGTLNTTSRLFTANGSFTFTATDAAGNVTNKTVNISNIDKTPPTKPTLVSSKTTPTNQNVNVTITYSGDSTIKQYKIGSGSWQNYTIPILITSNTVISARGQDVVGNMSAESTLNINNIVKTSPTISFSQDGNLVYAKEHSTRVDVGVTSPATAKTSQYAWSTSATAPTSGWVNFSSGVTLTKLDGSGNYYLHVQVEDTAGNTSAKTSAMFRLDNEAPIVNIENLTEGVQKEHQVKISAEDTHSGIKSLKYQWTTSSTFPETGVWKDIGSGQTLNIGNSDGEYYLHVHAEDKVGNVRKASSSVIILDNTAPKIDVKVSLTGVTRDKVLASASVNEGTLDKYTYEFTVDGQTTFKAIDEAGNKYDITIEVKNISTGDAEITIKDSP